MKKILLILVLSLLSACSNLPLIVKPKVNSSQIKTNKIYVVSNGWHTGFVVSSGKIQKSIKELKKRFGNAPFIEFGWGDKDFYQAKKITTSLTLQAIFWPTESVIYAVAVPEVPTRYFIGSEIQEICLSKNEYSSLIKFISNSFARDKTHKIIPLKKGIYGDSQFYKGEGDYYLMNTCNKWTAKGLASSGFDIFTTFKLTAGSIMDYLENEEIALTNNCNGQFKAAE